LTGLGTVTPNVTNLAAPRPLLRRFGAEILVGLVAVAWSAYLLLASDPRSTQTVSNLGLSIVPLVAAIGCFRRALGLTGRLRWSWALLGASCLAWATGQTIWTWYESWLSHEVPFPSLADAGYLAAVPLASAGLLTMPTVPTRLAGMLRMILDGLVVALALFCTSWILVLGPLFKAGGDGLLATVLSLAYPVGDVATITILLYAVMRSRHGGEASRQPLYLLGLGLAGIAVADSGFVYLTSQGSYASGSFIDIGWFVGFAVLFVASRRPERPLPCTEAREVPSFSSVAVPYVPVVIAAGTVLFQHLRGDPLDGVTVFAAMGVLLLIVGRQVLTLLENLTLMRTLEERVESRTADQKRLEEELTHQAFHDSLTGLANRALFKDRVGHALARQQRRRRSLAVLFLDLDRFKAINDSFGHASGDALLMAVSGRLLGCVRAEDTVARLGGDEFAILVENLASDSEVNIVADRVLAAFRDPILIEDREVVVAASLGVALSDTGTESADDLLRNADLAMYGAKGNGGGASRRYVPEMHAGVLERLELEGDLRHALARRELRLEYQPIMDLQTGRVSGAEALLRWKHPTRGNVSPASFIPVAEASGLIVPIGEWVLRRACQEARRWGDVIPGGERLTISVNLSPRQLQTAELPSMVPHALLESGLPAHRLVLEMTESILVDRTDETLTLLHELRRLGVRLAIDDFGTGYSSLSYLHRFPFDVVKIDQSFVERMSDESPEASLAGSIVRIGQGLRLTTVAEGIETATQLGALRSMGCELGQGFYYAPSLSPADFEAFAVGVIAERRAS
jgi:diguanylate cyclase (GGDEF)-like protein